ncbi:PPE family protein [Mycobacterium sp. 663a-19]|uniref:PPE family protein n=1 Tax=Mycobacterium sp. 663a-19 TaxID=2986148 RepID=UPI002D1F262F|nr:PPE family protein [Mycobacterium sp. 663a-19]MEB3983991.1 PPE family protein [Mycobacterium sp. 663a-19]
MDFGTLPPEINSKRMYFGPGPGSLLAAAAAWDRLADSLSEMATNGRAMTSGLAHGWRGSAATAYGESAAPYLRWLDATAAQAQRTAAQARAAAEAYESAFAATVPPQVIANNRALRRALAETNFLGQANPAIAAAEADYEKMWVADAAAMYAYADAAAAASAMPQFEPPPPAAPTGDEPTADEEVISAGAQLLSRVPHALKQLSCASPTGFDRALLAMSPALARLSSLRLGFARGASVPLAVAITGAAKSAARGTAVSAAIGRGKPIGRLSVPRTWAPAPRASAFSTDYHSAAAAIGRWASGQAGRDAP